MTNIEKKILKIQTKQHIRVVKANMEKKMSQKKNNSNPRRTNSSKRNKLRQRVKMLHHDCAICGLPIDYTLPPGHPGSYELDEIIPVSKGGDPYDINNVQATHRACNQRKGARILKKGIKIPKNDLNVKIGQITHSKEWLEDE